MDRSQVSTSGVRASDFASVLHLLAMSPRTDERSGREHFLDHLLPHRASCYRQFHSFHLTLLSCFLRVRADLQQVRIYSCRLTDVWDDRAVNTNTGNVTLLISFYDALNDDHVLRNWIDRVRPMHKNEVLVAYLLVVQTTKERHMV